MLFDIFLMLIFYTILKEFLVKFEYRIIGLSLLICPYLALEFNNANDLGYYSMLLGNCQAYAGRIILCLLIFLITIQIESGKNNYFLMGLSFLWSCVCGISSGLFVIIMIILPIVIFFVLKIVVENGKKFYTRPILFAILNAIAILSGKIIQTKVFHFTARDDAINFLHVGDFWKNLGNVVIGFFQLIGAYPTSVDISVTSFEGISYLLKIVYFLILLIAIITIIKKVSINKLEAYILPLFIILINILMFAIGSFVYGSEYFECRYLILDSILLSISLCLYLNEFSENNLWKKTVSFVLGLCILGSCVFSYGIYGSKTLDSKKYEYVISKINKEDVPVVFVSNNLGIDGRNWDVYLDNKNVKVFSLSDSETNFEEQLWGCSTAYGENAEWTGESILICQKDEFETYPAFFRKFYDEIGKYDDISIFKAEKNYLDFNSNVIYSNVNLFPYSPGVTLQNGSFSENNPTWISDGTEGYIMYGPYGKWLKGQYLVTIQYNVEGSKNDKAGIFDLVTNGGERVWASSDIISTRKEMTLKVSLDEDLDGYEVRCFEYAGTKMEIGKITIEKVQ